MHTQKKDASETPAFGLSSLCITNFLLSIDHKCHRKARREKKMYSQMQRSFFAIFCGAHELPILCQFRRENANSQRRKVHVKSLLIGLCLSKTESAI